jgi:hypothetical protein
MAGEAIAARRDQERNDWQTRGISGRIASIEGAKNEITVQLRGRGGQETVVVRQGPNVKILRYAPDSLRSTDARPSSFAELRVGDQIRVLGNRSSDGTVVTADEIISGSVTRTFGTITSINVAANEVTIKNEQDNRTTIVAFGKNSVVKRLPPEVAQNLAERREQRQQRRRTRSESTGVQTETPAGRRTRSGAAGTGRRGGGFQQLLEAQPAVSLGELKVGDALLVTGSQGSDASHVTAINAITGDPAAMQLMQRPAGRRQRDMSTGLPGGTAGGNASNDDEP